MPKKSGYGSKHMGKGVSRQMPNATGNGRRRSGSPVSDPNGARAKQSRDASNGRRRPTSPKYGREHS